VAHHKYKTKAKPTRSGTAMKFDTDSFHTHTHLRKHWGSISERGEGELISSSKSGEKIHMDIKFRKNCT
jgi:hypothetical protein